LLDQDCADTGDGDDAGSGAGTPFHEMTYDHFGPFLLETMLEALLWNPLFRCADQTCIQTRISLVNIKKLILKKHRNVSV